MRDAGVDLEAEAEGGKKPKLLFKANGKMPHKKLISMTRTDDLLATLTLGDAEEELWGEGLFGGRKHCGEAFRGGQKHLWGAFCEGRSTLGRVFGGQKDR